MQLTKREQIAAMALQGLLASLRWEFVRPDHYWESKGPLYPDLVKDAIDVADRLIELAAEDGEGK